MEELKQYFVERNISIEQIAERTGYSVNYVRNLLNGSDDLNDKAVFRLTRAYPETWAILLPFAHPAPADAQAA